MVASHEAARAWCGCLELEDIHIDPPARASAELAPGKPGSCFVVFVFTFGCSTATR